MKKKKKNRRDEMIETCIKIHGLTRDYSCSECEVIKNIVEALRGWDSAHRKNFFELVAGGIL